MKKFLIFLGLFLAVDSVALAVSYPDVVKDHKNYQAIEYLDEKQIIKGYGDGTFGPDKLVNRAEALKMIISALKVKHDLSYKAQFSDVKKEDWFFEYVMTAKNSGIVSGYKDVQSAAGMGKFHPANSVSLAETLKMLTLTAKVDVPKEVMVVVFADISKADWFAPYMLYARNHNMILPDDFGKIHPEQSMSRAAFAEILYRMMIILEKKGQPFPLDINWSRYTSTALPFTMKYDNKTWKFFDGGASVAFLRPDKQFLQFSPDKIYPNSAVVKVVLDPNEANLVEDQYFNNIKAAFGAVKYNKFKLGNFNALEVLNDEKRTRDWYIYLKNKVLVVYSEYGIGPLGFQFQQLIKAMLDSFEYHELVPAGEDYSKLLNDILQVILVEKKGMEALGKLPDELIIETDAIGVGTGPVDYYYSTKMDYTFKYERSKDVILDYRKGKTSAF